MKIHIIYCTLLCCLLTSLPTTAQTSVPSESSRQTACPMVNIEAEELSDMTTARSGHSVFRIGQEIVVVGGHTLGFIPVKTAEYYKDDEWTQMPTVYDHDGGLSLVMKTGKVLLAGGFEKHVGIGQTFVAEMYDPQTRSFEGFGCLDKKRTFASAVELDSIVADRLKGESFPVPLLNLWHPLSFELSYNTEESFIGDESKHVYAYLMPAEDKNGRIAIIKVQGLDFSLLPTSCPIPTETDWGDIEYISPILTDQQAQRGYMIGRDKDRRIYVLCIEYAKAIDDKSAPLTLYYTTPLPEAGNGRVILTAEGDLMLIGGVSGSDFTPFKTVFLIRFGTQGAVKGSKTDWLWIGLTLVILLILALVVFQDFRRRRIPQPLPIKEPVQTPVVENAKGLRLSTDTDEVLIQRICKLLEQERLYLNCELKVADIADRLGTNKRHISDCINTQKGITFIQLVNKYRIEYAKQLLKSSPDIKIAEVYIKSGFANETSFFRVFKALTGLTPNQYKFRKD